MVEQISSANTQQKLLGGNVSPSDMPVRARKKTGADVVVNNATEKRYLWTARAFAIIFGVSLCCNIILLYVMIAITPLYRVEPFLMSFEDKAEQIYKIIPVNNIYDQKYLTEIFVKEYVLLRNGFVNDIDEMEMRWGPNSKIREMSSNEVYKEFYDRYAKPTIEKIRQYNVSRSVYIASVTEVGGKEGGAGETWWQVQFRIEDMAPSLEAPKVQYWVSRIRIRYRAKVVKFGERLKNPLGFTVMKYVQESQKQGIN